MPVLNLNGVERKHGIATGRTIKGRIFGAGVAAQQHATIGFAGRTYNSPFTASSRPLFNRTQTTATQPHIAPTKVESPGQVVPLHSFVKVHPWEKGSHFATTAPVHAIVKRAGGPSKHANTPSNPNAAHLQRAPRPQRAGSQKPVEKQSHLSFVRSGGTLGAHVDPQAGTSSGVTRWAVVTPAKGQVI